jgi:hypothetical protein
MRAVRFAWIVVVLLVVSTSSCSSTRPHGRARPPTLQFAGDSITFFSAADIKAHYAGRYDVAIDATSGIDTYTIAPDIPFQARLAPDVEIIELGTNDANHIADPLPNEPAGSQTVTEVNARLDRFNALFPASTCVVFVTVNTHNPSWHPGYARAINDHIRAKFAHIADWDAAWEASYFFVPDDPHPNATGRQALLAVEDRAIAGCPRS